MTKILRALFIAFIVIFLSREILTYLDIIPMKYLLTPLITATVLWIAILSIVSAGASSYRTFIVGGLTTALIADSLLMIVEVDLLKYGLVFFLTTHIAYCIAFSRQYRFRPAHLISAAALLTYIAVFFYNVRGRTNGLDIPVLVYMVLFSTMAYFALGRPGDAGGRQRILLAVGALLFLVSDSVLAVNAFLSPIPHSTVFTWLTYAPAQVMIALSCYD